MKKIITSLLLALSFTSMGFAAQKNHNCAEPDLSKVKFRFMASGGVNTLVVSCIDYRLRTETENYLVGRFGPDSYDEVALAGAALGVLNDKFANWNTMYTQNLDVAIQLHGVNRVIFVDHRDCGAYKTIVGPQCCTDEAVEDAAHEAQFVKVRQFMKEKYPNVKVETLLMNLDGTVKTFGASLDESAVHGGESANAKAQSQEKSHTAAN